MSDDTDREELARLGEQVFGRAWQRRLAEAFEIHATTVNTWATGRNGATVPAYVLVGLRAMAKVKEYEDAREDLTKAAAAMSRVIRRL